MHNTPVYPTFPKRTKQKTRRAQVHYPLINRFTKIDLRTLLMSIYHISNLHLDIYTHKQNDGYLLTDRCFIIRFSINF